MGSGSYRSRGVGAATIRRRRLAAALACGLAVGAFALGARLADRSPPRPSFLGTLPPGELAGQRLILGFPGRRPPAAVVRMVRAGRVAGVILFAENLPSRAIGRASIARLQAIPRPPGLRSPLLVMTDQEGGLVKRVDGPPDASARAMGARGAALSEAEGRRTAASLRGLGVNVDLAPVLDVADPGGAIAAAQRAFGSTAARVAATAVPFAEGLQSGGVAATGKHFPGLGAAPVSTDEAPQSLALPAAELRSEDERPYRRFAAAGGELVMLSTATYPALAPKPAAFAAAIATGELRSRLGFAGVSISDALDTPAVRAFGDAEEVATAAARAGTDLLLYTRPRAAARAWRALRRGLERGSLARPSFEASVGRVLRLRRRLGAG
jgi:beta-N-acetylhexosaminidase